MQAESGDNPQETGDPLEWQEILYAHPRIRYINPSFKHEYSCKSDDCLRRVGRVVEGGGLEIH